MKIDLSATAGFPCYLDPQTLIVSGKPGYEFKRIVRHAADLSQVFMSPYQADPQAELYYMDFILPAPPEQAALDRYALTYSTVLLPPLRVGGEFVKTHGHYHPALPGSAVEFPEIYTQLSGNLLLLMQKRSANDPEALEDCAITLMTPGYVITIPPGYAHILINPTAEPALMAGLYGRAFKPDYEPVRARQGLAYYVVPENGSYKVVPNQRYTDTPPLRWLGDLRGTIFEPPFPGKPVWRTYLDNPPAYAFLTQPEAARMRFGG